MRVRDVDAPERDGPVDELRRVGRHRSPPRVVGVVGVLPQHALGDVPAGVECRRVEPAIVVPARDVGRIEEQLSGLNRQPDVVLGRDAVAEDPQHAREIDGRRLHHPGALVEPRVLEDRAQDGPRRVARLDVELLERGLGLVVRRLRDEVAPELAREERLVRRVGDRQHHGLLPAVRAGLVEDDLHRVVVPVAVEAEPDPAVPVLVRRGEPGQGPGLLAHVTLRVAGAVAQGEQLHQLAGVVLVRRALLALEAVEVQQHRGVLRHPRDEAGERAEPRPPEHVVLADHQALRADGLVRCREPVVPDERHSLRQRPARPHHPVEPPQVVVPELVEREQPVAVDLRRLADEVVRAGREQVRDGAVEAARGERSLLARSRAESGAPEKPLGLGGSKMTRDTRAAACDNRRRRGGLGSIARTGDVVLSCGGARRRSRVDDASALARRVPASPTILERR